MKTKLLILVIFLSMVSFTLIGCGDTEIVDDSLNVLFYSGKGTPIDTIFNVEEGELIERPADPTLFGKAFAGWYKDPLYKEEWDFDADVVVASTLLYAKWQINRWWTISYTLNEELGDTYTNPKGVISNFDIDSTGSLPILKRNGATYKGWILVPSDEYNNTMKVYQKITELPIETIDDFVLYPHFEKMIYKVQLLDNKKPLGLRINGIEWGSVIDFLPDVVDTDTHKFVGWFSLNGIETGDWGVQYKNGDLVNFTSQAADVKIFVRWEEI